MSKEIIELIDKKCVIVAEGVVDAFYMQVMQMGLPINAGAVLEDGGRVFYLN